VSSACIRHIDSSFRLQREGDYAGLFRDAECLDLLADLIADRDAIVARARAVLAAMSPMSELANIAPVRSLASFRAIAPAMILPAPIGPSACCRGLEGPSPRVGPRRACST